MNCKTIHLKALFVALHNKKYGVTNKSILVGEHCFKKNSNFLSVSFLFFKEQHPNSKLLHLTTIRILKSKKKGALLTSFCSNRAENPKFVTKVLQWNHSCLLSCFPT